MQTFIHCYANFFIKLNTLLNTQLQYGKFYNNYPFCNLSKNTLKQSIILKKANLIQREILSRAKEQLVVTLLHLNNKSKNLGQIVLKANE